MKALFTLTVFIIDWIIYIMEYLKLMNYVASKSMTKFIILYLCLLLI